MDNKPRVVLFQSTLSAVFRQGRGKLEKQAVVKREVNEFIIMSEENRIEKRALRGNLRLSRKQKTERVRRERINTSLDELKCMVCKDDEKSEKMDKADILESTVSYVRNSRAKEYQQNPNFRSGYNQCVSEFVQFLISLESVQAEDKAKLLAGMATILCGVKKEGEEPEKVSAPKVQRQPLNQLNLNILPTTASYSTSPLRPVITESNTPQSASYSTRISLSSVGSLSSNSSTELNFLGNKMTELPDSFDAIESVFSETSGLETSLARAVSASINIPVNDLPSDNEDIEEMVGSLPPMRSFLGL